ncbi:MAG: hypothetical protein WBG90_03270 [Saonia sp.]
MKRNRHTSLLLLILISWLPVGLFSQQLPEKQESLSFFEHRALVDAQREQLLRLHLEKDELDFWKDQRNFEKALQQHSLNGYYTYLIGKRTAYAEHEKTCGQQCAHGDYYYLMAAYYSQIGLKDDRYDPEPIKNTGKATTEMTVVNKGNLR